MSRRLDWDGCLNVRDLGGLPTADERGSERSGVGLVHLPLDGVDDREFWEEWGGGPQFGTPLYYGPHLDRFPERNAQRCARGWSASGRRRPTSAILASS